MNHTQIDIAIDIISTVFASIIMATYWLNAHWNLFIIRKFRENKIKDRFLWLKVYEIIISFIVMFVYIYIIYISFIGDPHEIATLFNMLIVRPLVLLIGSILTSNTRIRRIEIIRLWKEGGP